MNKRNYEVVVVGGGMVGASLALALARSGFSVMVIDSVVAANDARTNFRVSAINCASVALLHRIGTWQHLDKQFCAPYRRLETWEWASSMLAFDSDSLNLPELGFMVENYRLQQALWHSFTACNTLSLCCPASLVDMVWHNGIWRLTLDDGSAVFSRLLVGADGANSWVRQQAGIAVIGWQYRQSCLLLRVEMDSGQQQDVTWQVLHPSGPRAFLPLYGRLASLVWYDSTTRIRQLKKIPFTSLAKEVQAAFPDWLGDFTLHDAAFFPLTRHHARGYVLPGLALVGDAAHTINPLAGQGANLGFRDADALAKVLITARNRGECWEQLAILQRYERRRRADNMLMQAGIDAFYTTFSTNWPPVVLARNLGLMFAQRAGRLKHHVLRYALGLLHY